MNIKKILNPKVIGMVTAGAAAFAAFVSELDSQAKEKEFKKLKETVESMQEKLNS